MCVRAHTHTNRRLVHLMLVFRHLWSRRRVRVCEETVDDVPAEACGLLQLNAQRKALS